MKLFYIRSNKDTDKALIYLHVRKQKNEHSINIKYYPGLVIDPEWWLPASQRVKEREDIPFKDINRKLGKMELAVRKLFLENDISQVTEEMIRSELDDVLGVKTKIDITDFIEFSKIPILKRFKKRISFSDINYQFLKDVSSWMAVTTSERGEVYKASTISMTVKRIKASYREAVKQGLAEFKPLDYSFPNPKVVSIYLTESDLDKLYNLELTGMKELCRDWFLIGCYTGLRAGNYLALTKSNINIEQGYLETVVNKGGPLIKIPLHRVVRELFSKYDGEIPPGPGICYFDRLIKTICKEAKIDDKVIIPVQRGNIRSEVEHQKWELVSSHTARRTMATQLYLRNVPLRYIMSILGHRNEATTLHYIKAGINEVYDDVAKLDFWK